MVTENSAYICKLYCTIMNASEKSEIQSKGVWKYQTTEANTACLPYTKFPLKQ